MIKLYDRIYKRIGSEIYYRYPRWRKYMPDKMYLQCIWRDNMGYELDVENPQTFNEKLQWLKLYNRKSVYTTMVDKATAKEYVASIIGEEYIIPTYGVYNTFDEIDFGGLPNQFVIKSTHDSGGVYICKDKSKLDKEKARSITEGRFGVNVYHNFREWPYKNVKPRILVEKYMENEECNGLVDYKFYCFNGKAKYLYVSEGLENHKTAKISFLTLDWEFAPFGRSDFSPFSILPPQPSRFKEMVKIANILAERHPFIRVDLYQVKNKIYFSELTFYPCAGMMPFEPKEWDYKLGLELTLEKNR